MRVDQVGLELSERGREVCGAINGEPVQPVVCDEAVTQGFIRLGQGQHTDFKSAPAQLGQFPGNKGFGELRKTLDDVCDTACGHGAIRSDAARIAEPRR